MIVHINNGENKPICGANDFIVLAYIKDHTSCQECQNKRAEALRKLKTLRRLEADRKIIYEYIHNGKNLSDEDLESYKIRLQEVKQETENNHPQSITEAYLMSELSMPITEVEHV